MRRRPASPGSSDPRAILGSLLALWVRGDYVTASSSAVVDSAQDRANGQTVAQGTTAKKPTALISLGRPAIRSDGVDDTLTCTLSPTLNGRSYVWLVARAVSLPGATAYADSTHNGTQQHLAACRMTVTNFTAVLGCTDGTDIIVGPTRDTNVHLFEVSFEASSTGRYVVDGIAYSGSFSGTHAGVATTTVQLFAFPALPGVPAAESNWGPFDIFEYGLCTDLPSTDQRSALRAYAQRRYSVPWVSPKTILGSSCVYWVRSDDVDIATGVSRVYDRAKGSAQDALQATGANQPAAGASTITGRAYIKGDASNDYLVSNLSATISSGSRPWAWMVFKANATGTVPATFWDSSSGYTIGYQTTGTPVFYCGLVSTDTSAGEGINGPTFDTNLHLHEFGFPATNVGRYVVDGVSYNGTHTGGTFRNCDRVCLAAIHGPGGFASFSDAEIYEVVLADSQPSATQFAQMRDYFRRSYGLSIA